MIVKITTILALIFVTWFGITALGIFKPTIDVQKRICVKGSSIVYECKFMTWYNGDIIYYEYVYDIKPSDLDSTIKVNKEKAELAGKLISK